MEEEQQGRSEESLRKVKHDIKNQLANIYLALEQRKYEMPDASADCLFYLDTISRSSTQINMLLDDTK